MRNLILPSAAVLLGPFLSGCAGALVEQAINRQAFSDYKIGEQKSCSVGDSIISVERAGVRDAYEVTKDYQTPFVGIGQTPQIPLKKGDRFTVVGIISNRKDIFLVRPEGKKSSQFIAISGDGKVSPGWLIQNEVGGLVQPYQGSWTKDPLFQKSNSPTREAGSFKAQIIYSGLSGRTMKAVYREFADDYARPAFSQELQYNLDESSTISYKTVKIEILKATNNSIDYKVLSDGNLPWLPQ